MLALTLAGFGCGDDDGGPAGNPDSSIADGGGGGTDANLDSGGGDPDAGGGGMDAGGGDTDAGGGDTDAGGGGADGGGADTGGGADAGSTDAGGGGTDAGGGACPNVFESYTITNATPNCTGAATDATQSIETTGTQCEAHFVSSGGGVDGTVTIDDTGAFQDATLSVGSGDRTCDGTYEAGVYILACGMGCVVTLTGDSVTP